MTIEFKPEIFNPVYYEAFNSRERFLHLLGGAGSGKSVAAAQKCLIRVMKEKHKILYSRKVAKTIRNSQFSLFREIIGMWKLVDYFDIQKSTMDITFKPTGSMLLASGLDDVEKIKSITGITSQWIEEATELEEDDLRQLNLRMRGESEGYKQIILTYNPIDDEHFLAKLTTE